MPLFHFNSCTGDAILADPEGEELPSLSAAREVALTTAREALIEAVKVGDVPPDYIQVTDSQGNEVAIVPLTVVLQAVRRWSWSDLACVASGLLSNDLISLYVKSLASKVEKAGEVWLARLIRSPYQKRSAPMFNYLQSQRWKVIEFEMQKDRAATLGFVVYFQSPSWWHVIVPSSRSQAKILRNAWGLGGRPSVLGNWQGQQNDLSAISHKLKSFAEVVLGNLFVGIDPLTSNNNSNPESVDDPHLVKAFLPKLIWLDFLHRRNSRVGSYSASS
jgi:hypothetical protein